MSPYVKQLLALLGFSLFAGSLALFAVFGVSRQDAEQERQRANEGKLLARFSERVGAGPKGLSTSAFTELHLDARGAQTSLQRQPDGGWELTAPERAAADNMLVEGLLGQLVEAKVMSTVASEPRAEEIEKYGFAPPRFKLTVTAKGDGAATPSTLLLEGGGENPFDESFYLRSEETPAVFQLSGDLARAMDHSPFDLRDKHVFPQALDTLQKLEVVSPTHRFTLEKTGDDTWKLTAPQPGPADSSAVTSLLTSASNELATAFLTSPSKSEREALGLEQPELLVTFTLQDAPPIRYALGRPLAERSTDRPEGSARLFLSREGGPGPSLWAQVDIAVLNLLNVHFTELADRTLVRFSEDAVHTLQLDTPKGTPELRFVRARKSDAGTDRWSVVSPVQAEADIVPLTELLQGLSALRISNHGLAAPSSWEPYGLDVSAQRLRLFDASGKALVDLRVGKVLADPPNRIYARTQDSGVLELEADKVHALLDAMKRAVPGQPSVPNPEPLPPGALHP